MRARSERLTRIVGREPECAAVRDFLAAGPPGRALALVGEPGIGKTTLWEAGIAIGRERGQRALCARPSGAETGLSFAALIDLFDGVDTGALALPEPQRAALEAALLRAQPTTAPPPHAVAIGFLNALRALAAEEPLVVAIDDVQWLEPSSAGALAFTVRRLEGERIALPAAPRRCRR